MSSSYCTSFISDVRSPVLQMNYYVSDCHVKQGKLHGSADRQKTALSQVYSACSVTLTSSHMVQESKSQKHAVHLFFFFFTVSRVSQPLSPSMSFFCCRTYTFICQMLLFKVPHKWGIKPNCWWLTVSHNYILNGRLVILGYEPTTFRLISQNIINWATAAPCYYSIALITSFTNAYTFIILMSCITCLLRKRSQKDFESWNYFCIVPVDQGTVGIIMLYNCRCLKWSLLRLQM